MKIDAKRFKNKDLRTMCGSITFKAEDEVDAIQLAALYNNWLAGIEDNGSLGQMRRESLEKYHEDLNMETTN